MYMNCIYYLFFHVLFANYLIVQFVLCNFVFVCLCIFVFVTCSLFYPIWGEGDKSIYLFSQNEHFTKLRNSIVSALEISTQVTKKDVRTPSIPSNLVILSHSANIWKLLSLIVSYHNRVNFPITCNSIQKGFHCKKLQEFFYFEFIFMLFLTIY